MTRHASCRCGQLSLICTGDPVRVSVCHCYDCQKRSGSVCAVQARFPAEAVTVSGDAKVYEHIGDSGNVANFNFCPTCGTHLWYHAQPDLTLFAVPVGTFADKDFPPPDYSVYEERKHSWLSITGENIEHYD